MQELPRNGEELGGQQSNVHLVQLLSDQHDAKNVAASRLLLSDWVAKQAASAGASEMAEIARRLHRDVKRFADLVSSPAKASQFELAKQNAPELSSLAGVFEEIFAQLNEQYDVSFERPGARIDTPVWTVGGQATLRRVFFNVLLNCCQGNGKRGASHVVVRQRQHEGAVLITIEDDGPGFGGVCAGSKIGGWGVGLELVATLVTASGGSFTWGDRRDAIGAVFEFRLLS